MRSAPRRRHLVPLLAVLAGAELVAGVVGVAVAGRPGGGSVVGHRASAAPAPSRSGPASSTGRLPAGSTGLTRSASPGGSGNGAPSSDAGGTSTPSGVAPAGQGSLAPGGGAESLTTAAPRSGSRSGAAIRSSGTPAPVHCRTDLALSGAPDAPYGFLCLEGSRPITWPTNHVVVYDAGLSPVQTAAFALAVVQWESAARFRVTYTTDRARADVVVTAAALSSGQPGYTEDGYTTVSYRCDPSCTYYHADLTLSSTAGLTYTDWMSTFLHELGHVAGLNHVARTSEVMYPYLTAASPVLYAAGDRTGFQILASERRA